MTSIVSSDFDAPSRPARDGTRWLGLAASPTFAVMAWVAAVDAPRFPSCFSASGAPPIDGMAWMYLLMCLFHLSPWLKLVGSGVRLPHPTS